MKKTISRAVRLFLILAILVAAGCSDDESIGSGVKAEGGSGDAGALRDSNTTVATESAPTTAPPAAGGPATTAAPATTAPPTTQPQPENIINIQDDDKGSYFDPVMFQIPVGGLIVWKNVSSEPRSVVAEDGSFTSPEIPPGGSFRWKATGPGRVINYTDGSRPYAQAQLQVY